MANSEKFMISFSQSATDFALLAGSPLACQLYFYLLHLAATSQKRVIYRGELVTLAPGEVITSRQRICADLRCGEGVFRSAVQMLVDEGLIAAETSRRFSRYSILGYRPEV